MWTPKLQPQEKPKNRKHEIKENRRETSERTCGRNDCISENEGTQRLSEFGPCFVVEIDTHHTQQRHAWTLTQTSYTHSQALFSSLFLISVCGFSKQFVHMALGKSGVTKEAHQFFIAVSFLLEDIWHRRWSHNSLSAT